MPERQRIVIVWAEWVVAILMLVWAVAYIWTDLKSIDTSRVPKIVDETLVEDSATGQPATLVSYSNGTKEFVSQVSPEEWEAMAKSQDTLAGRLVIIAIAVAMPVAVFLSDRRGRRRKEARTKR